MKDNPFYFGRKTQARGKPKDPEAVKRGKSAKRKGKRREKQWGEFVCKLIGGEAIVRHGDRDVQFVDNGLAHIHSEVKGYARFAFTAHCRQAALDSAHHGLPRYVVACKADREPWYCIVDAVDYVKDMQELAERRERDVGEGWVLEQEVPLQRREREDAME
jgi:hypothetical protein